MKKMLVGIVMVILLGGAAVYYLSRNNNAPTYRTEKAVRGDIQETVTATGTLNAVTTVLVGTQVSGTISHLYVDFNSPVKKGQLIAQIDPATFKAQVDQARANLYSAKANLDKADTALVGAKRTFERNKELFSKGLIAQSDLDTAETNYEADKAAVGAAKAQIAHAEAALEFAETNFRYTDIISPVNGVVISRNVDVGQTVAASFQTPTLFIIADDLTKMQIDTNVNEADVGKIMLGQDVEFTVDAYPDRVFKGTVLQIRSAPIIVQNVVTYDVVIKVDNADLKLKPGMTANTSIITAVRKAVLRIPDAALRFRPSEKTTEKGPGVWVLADGKIKKIKVKAGVSDGSFTELVSGDIKEGQELVVEALQTAKKPTTGGPRMF